MKKEMSKKELVDSISHKAQKAVPMVRKIFLRGLEYKNKKELNRINNKMKVSKSGWEISTI